jgi:hypothetical protein
MNCPKCDANTTPGFLAVHGTVWGWFFVGQSWQYCWWQPDYDPKQEVELIAPGGSRCAYKCEKCRMIVIPDA